MSLIKTLLDVGGEVVANTVPFGSSLVKIVKSFIGEDKEIKEDVTGAELAKVMEGLDSDSLVRITESYNAVLMNESDNYRMMQESFSEVEKTGKSRRGEISVIYTWATIVWITMLLVIFGWVAYKTETYPSEWLLVSLLIYPFGIIGQYFGIKSSELKQLADLASPMTGAVKKPNMVKAGIGALGSILKRR